MVDGFGIPPIGWRRSFFYKFSPEFTKLISENSIPVDTNMGVNGIPQSATGQSSIFTGLNTASIMGAHIPGFPGPKLKKIIIESNLFKFFAKRGLNCAFANAYVRFSLEDLNKMNLKSVTTVMLESVLGWTRDIEKLLSGQAVYHDITNKSIASDKIPIITPEKAAENLLRIAEKNDFTLFEYFLTDRAGHSMDIKFLKECFDNLSRFILEIIKGLKSNMAFFLTSDHGNSEDLSVKTHTKNPVPLMGINTNFNKLNCKIEEISTILKNTFDYA